MATWPRSTGPATDARAPSTTPHSIHCGAAVLAIYSASGFSKQQKSVKKIWRLQEIFKKIRQKEKNQPLVLGWLSRLPSPPEAWPEKRMRELKSIESELLAV
jgi:hypothetical protein